MFGSLKGAGALLVAAVVFAALAVMARSFFLIILAAAAVAVLILHFWNKRPVKTPYEEQVRLNLNEEPEDKRPG